MMSKARITNIAKNALIVILFLSALCLLMSAMNTSPAALIKSLYHKSENPAVSFSSAGLESITTSAPHLLMLTEKTDGHVVHYAAKYNFQAKNKLFAQLSVTLGEALGSASAPTEITEVEWRSALSSAGVYFDYLYPQPLDLIATQLGTHTPEAVFSATARRFCLAGDGEALYIYYVNSATGKFFRLSTALSPGVLGTYPAVTELHAASFAFETDYDLAQLDPYFVFSGEELLISSTHSVSLLTLSQSDPVSLEAFSMNEGTSTQYPESDDTIVYIDGVDKRLRIRADGTVLFTATGSGGIPVSYSGEAPSLGECITSAAALIAATIESSCGDAEIGLMDIEENADSGVFVLRFRYYVNGIPVKISTTDWCARIEIAHGRIMRAELVYREYSVRSEYLTVFPERFMAISAQKEGRSPLLFYDDAGGELTATWY